MERKGTIIKGIGGFYYVDCGDVTVECHARGKFRKNSEIPIVGDVVTVLMNDDGTGSVSEIAPRTNFLIRPGVSNVDAIVLVSAAKSPMPDFLLTDKLLVTAESKGIKGIICLNKSDLITENEAESFAEVYTKAGYPVFIVSAEKNIGIDALSEAISGKTAAFAGLSGVGKSSILRKITGKSLETGKVSRIERGKHTTRHIELMNTGRGFVFDTPGFSRLETDELRAENLWEYFPEICRLYGECRFRTCSHTGEPGCAVIENVKNGNIAESRHESYVTIFNRLKNIKDWERKD